MSRSLKDLPAEEDDGSQFHTALDFDDAFLRATMLAVERKHSDASTRAELLADQRPRLRQAGLILTRQVDPGRADEVLPAALKDPDPLVRFVAVQWIAEERLTKYREDVFAILGSADSTRQLFEAALAGLALLDGEPGAPVDEHGADHFVAQLVVRDATPPPVRRRALRVLRPDHAALTPEVLEKLLTIDDAELRREVVWTMTNSPREPCRARLTALVGDASLPSDLRAVAVMGLRPDSADRLEQLLTLAEGDDAALRDEALRSLWGATLSEAQRSRLEAVARRNEALAEAVGRLVREPGSALREKWRDVVSAQTSLAGAADPAVGERVFHSRAAQCSRCHEVGGRGGKIGPELSRVGATLNRERLVRSVVFPSADIAPLFVPWTIVTTEGKTLTGLLVSELVNGQQIYADPKGERFTLWPRDIESREPAKNSLMPEGLCDQLTKQELRDVLAYLEQQGK